MKRLVLVASLSSGLLAAAACGDEADLIAGGDVPTTDAAVDVPAVGVDASGSVDAASDVAPDAAADAAEDAADAAAEASAPIHRGEVSILEEQVLAPAPAPVNTIAGQGIRLGITFTDSATFVPRALDTDPGTELGCKVTVLDTSAKMTAALGVNEGSVQLTVNNGGAPPNPVYPACSFVPGAGYICPDPTSSQALTAVNSVTLDQVNPQVTRITVNAGTATFDAQDIGRYVKFSATGVAFLDAPHGAMPLVASGPTANQVFAGAPIPIASIPLTMGMMTTLAGVGFMPGLADPGQLSDSASVTAALTPGGGNHFPATTITYSNVGDDFTMDATNAARMREIPRDGSSFTIACDACGTSIASILTITTTDASVAGLSPFAMPTPTSKRVDVRCAVLGATTITVPANVSAYIMSSGATRIRTSFVRGTFGAVSPQNAGLAWSTSGHAMVGYTTPP